MRKHIDKNSGLITIEATIALTTFIFAILTVLSVINVCIVQARMAYAINSTAKEISQYSYLYSMTGIPDSQAKIANAAKNNTENVTAIVSNVGTMFDSIDSLRGNTEGAYSSISSGNVNVDDISNSWKEIVGDVNNIKEQGSKIYENFQAIANDPKKVIIGFSQMAATTGMDLLTSNIIAAPLAKVMIQKHLVNSKGGSVESYLKSMGIVPLNGSYMNGLDFSQSTFFPGGKNIVTVTVIYEAKIIPILPIKYQYKFCQTAKTAAWSVGDVNFVTGDTYLNNETLWTEAELTERANFIRHQVLADLKDKGYEKTVGLTDVPAYSPTQNEFVLIASMNPLWSAEGDSLKTLEDLNENAIRSAIERLSGNIRSSTDRASTVKVKKEDKQGSVTYNELDCKGASKKVILVIPEDEGLKEIITQIASSADTKGVVIEIQASYGNGAAKTVVSNGEGS